MTSSNSKKLIERIEEEKKRGANPRFFDFFKELFQIQADTEKKTGKVKSALKKEDIDSRQRNGISLIGYSDLVIDWPLLNDTYDKLSKLFAKYPDIFGEAFGSMELPESQKILSRETVKAWFNEDILPAGTEEDGTVNPLFIETLIHSAIKPFLVSNAKVLIDSVKQEEWRRLQCPICGGKPDIAFMEKEYGARWLVCSRCDTEWMFQRLQCPYCANEDQTKLNFFSDEDDAYRLYVCDNCHSYIKTIDLRKAKSDVFIPLERILTIDMDRQAQEKGYSPGHFEDAPDSE
ncbi:formate dehydrogenase accessory protein FdhE [Chloroflexota bacterium]